MLHNVVCNFKISLFLLFSVVSFNLLCLSGETGPSPPSKRNKDRDHKKKKLKSTNSIGNAASTPTSLTPTESRGNSVVLKDTTTEIKIGTNNK